MPCPAEAAAGPVGIRAMPIFDGAAARLLQGACIAIRIEPRSRIPARTGRVSISIACSVASSVANLPPLRPRHPAVAGHDEIAITGAAARVAQPPAPFEQRQIRPVARDQGGHVGVGTVEAGVASADQPHPGTQRAAEARWDDIGIGMAADHGGKHSPFRRAR